MPDTAIDTRFDIDLTPAALDRIYRRQRDALAILRERLGRPLTLSEKIVLGHLDDPTGQELVPGKSQLRLRPDRVAFQDVLGQTGMLQFMQTGRDRVAIPTTIHCDHLIEARSAAGADLAASIEENGEVYDFLRTAAAHYGCGFWGPGAGIIHQVILENYAAPGVMILGTDSHTPNAGGLGAAAVGVGGADAVEAIAGLGWELLYPRRIGVVLTGKLSGWAAPKDVILWVAGQLGVAGGTNAIVEYVGPGADAISATGKATITNMGAELGATTSIFGFDDAMARYLEVTGRADLVALAAANADNLRPDPEVLADPEAHYDVTLHLDLSALEPHLVGPHSPDRARPISALAAEVADPANRFVDEISAALIGSCTNSSYEDMSRAADVAAQAASAGFKTAAPFLVTPGSERVRATVARDGQLDLLRRIGGGIYANACGPCIGLWRRPDDGGAERPNSIVTSFNRNFPARNDGRRETMNFIASPEIVTALAIAGRLSFNPLTDSLAGPDGKAFRFEPPKPAPDVPSRGFEEGRAAYIAPPGDGKVVDIAIAAESRRLARLAPWPAWDGADVSGAFVLARARGKTTTDQISPAGPWLSLRGHLERFSDNMLSGVVNAFSGEIGRGVNLLDGRVCQTYSDIARAYRAAGRHWIIIGDQNYGEGSSREHAALSPRLLGCRAVIARSFARIHETNLKKQGILALTFADPGDYNAVREDDRVDIPGLDSLAPGRPLAAILRHSDGSVEEIALTHSYTASQLEWYRAGSALNTIRLQSA